MSPAWFLGLVVAATVVAALTGMGLGLTCAMAVRWVRERRRHRLGRFAQMRALLED